MDYGQLVIAHLVHRPVCRWPIANEEDGYYSAHGFGLPRARLPHWRLGEFVARLMRSLLQPPARVHMQ